MVKGIDSSAGVLIKDEGKMANQAV